MKKLFSIFLSVLFIVTLMTPVFCLVVGEESSESPETPMRYSLTSSISAGLSISGGTAHVTGIVNAKYASAYCSIKVKLQKKDSSGAWHSVKTWSSSGTLSASAGGNVAVSSGSYRNYVSAIVTYNGDSEHPYKDSGTKTC